MSTGQAGGEKISERLHESLERLRADIDRVEMWAGALEGFSQPIPDYDAARRYRLSAGDSDQARNNGGNTLTKNGRGNPR